MSARQSEDGLGLLGGMPDPTVLERMLSAAGLSRANGAAAAGAAAATQNASIAAAVGNLNRNSTTTAATASFAAALESIVREEQEATAAAEAAAAEADAALLRAASEQQRRAGGEGGGAAAAAAAAPPPPQEAPASKVCRLCKLEQPIDSFYRVSTSRDGRDSRCRACDARQCAERRKRRRGDGEGPSVGGAPPPTEKLCRKCGALKPAASFYKNSASGDGLTDACKPCFNAAATARRDEKVRRRREEALAAGAAAAAASATAEKHCRRCAQILPTGDFFRNSAAVDGLASRCKRCHGELTAERAEQRRRSGAPAPRQQPAQPQQPQEPRPPRRRPHPQPEDGRKDCKRCGVRKPRSEFHASKAAADGLQGYCKTCFTENAAERRRKNAELRGNAANRLVEIVAERR